MKKTRIQHNVYLEICDCLEDASFSLAEKVEDIYQKGVARNFVIPEGSTPKTFYKYLADKNVDWKDALFILSDKRGVASDSKSKEIYFLIAGENKSKKIHACLHGDYEPISCPAQFLLRNYGKPINFILDKLAASEITQEESQSCIVDILY